LRSLHTSPRRQQQQLAGVGDALENVVIDEPSGGGTIRANKAEQPRQRVWRPERLARCQFGDGHDLGLADLGFVEALLLRRRRFAVVKNLTDPQVIVLEHLEASLFLHAMVFALRPPADYGFLVPPRRQ